MIVVTVESPESINVDICCNDVINHSGMNCYITGVNLVMGDTLMCLNLEILATRLICVPSDDSSLKTAS